MKIKWGLAITDGRGKLGGHVASKNRSGAILRTLVIPANPQSVAQTNVRSRFTNYSQGWRGLTDSQRASWRAAVDNFKTPNKFGDLVAPSGSNLYQRINNNLVTIGQAAVDVPPTPSAVDDIVIGVLTAVAATSLSLAYTAGSGGSILKVFATPAVSPGRAFVKSLYKLISATVASDAVSPYDAYAAYSAVFGDVGTAGQKIYIKTVAVDTTTGLEGTPQVASAIIG